MSGDGSPWRLSRAGWIAVAKQVWQRVGENNVGLIAAGVAFYGFVAIVPTLASLVLSYGLFADAETVQRNIDDLFGVLPEEAARLVGEQLVGVVETSAGQQGLGLAVALVIALYGATKATSSMVTALNIAFGLSETRGFVRLNLLAFAMVVAGVLLALTALSLTGVLAFLGSFVPGAPGVVLAVVRIASYALFALLVVTAAAALYRFAPAHAAPRWAWLTPGAALATAGWLAGTAGFGFYAANFGNYGATYGSLSAVVVLLTWLWLSAYIFLLGAELNAVLDRRTALGIGTVA